MLNLSLHGFTGYRRPIRMRRRTGQATCAVAALAISLSPFAAARPSGSALRYRAIPLPFTPVALNNRGVIVGTYGSHIALWTDGKLAIVRNLGYRYRPAAINDDGVVVGYNTSGLSGPDNAAGFELRGGVVTMTKEILMDVNAKSYVLAAVQGNSSLPSECIARADRSGEVLYDLKVGTDASATYVHLNDRDACCGWKDFNSQTHPVLWRDGRVADLGLPPGEHDGRAVAISDGGDVVVHGELGNSYGYGHLYVWHGGQYSRLAILPGCDFSNAQAINAAGTVAGCCAYTGPAHQSPPFYRYPCVWVRGELVNLISAVPGGSGADLDDAVGINDKGQVIVKVGHPHRSASGKYVFGYLLTPY